jgi:hypothetical protein
MRRAIAKQAEAERERRAKVISAQGELQASATLAEAARVMATQPASLQLRYLQTVAEIATENNSTTIFPVPIDMLSAFFRRAVDPSSAQSAATPAAGSDAPLTPTPPVLPLPNVAEALPQVRADPVRVDVGESRREPEGS